MKYASIIWGIGIILVLYFVKASIFRRAQDGKVDWQLFLLSICLCIPITWSLFPDDWSTNFLFTTYVCNPISVLTMPCISFAIDLKAHDEGKNPAWTDRHYWEIVLGVPVWFAFWAYFCAFGLGLVFI